MPVASLRPLRHRRFAALLVAGTVSNVGTWMETVAVGALVYKNTGRASWTTLVAAATFLPIGVLSPVGGVLADRIDRRTALMAANAFEALLATVLAILAATHHATAGAVVAVAFCEGCSSALRMPFQQAVIPDLVPPDDLFAAVSLGSAQYNAGRVVGPALAALVIPLAGFAGAFAANAVSFFAVIAAWAFIGHLPMPAPAEGDEGATIWGRIRVGARTSWADPGCRAAISLIAVAAVLVSPFIALIPAKAGLLVGQSTDRLASATGILTTVQGIGAVIGALALAPLAERIGHRHVLVGALLAAPVCLAAFAFAPTVALAAAALTLLGMTYIGILSGLSTIVQLRAPAATRARVLSLFFVALGVLYPIGALVQGTLADAFGFGRTVAAGGALMIIVVGVLALVRPAVLRALDPSPESSTDDLPVPHGAPMAQLDAAYAGVD